MSEQAILSDKQILVVDDNEGARESIKMLLGIDGHRVTLAKNGAEALGRFAENRFDLVITDYLMPRMLGDELAQNIRDLAPEQPILMVTAYFENVTASRVAADAILAKPFGVDELRLAMATPLAKSVSSAKGQSSPESKPSESCRREIIERAGHTTQILKEILQQRSTTLDRNSFGG